MSREFYNTLLNNKTNMKTIHSQIKPGKTLIIDSNLKVLDKTLDEVNIANTSFNKKISYNSNSKGLIELEHYIRSIANTVRMTGSNKLCLVIQPEDSSINISLGVL